MFHSLRPVVSASVCALSFLLLMASLALSLLLLAPDAQAGTYTWTTTDASGNITAQSPIYSGGTMTDTGHDPSVPDPGFALSSGYGASTKVYAFTPAQCSITVSGSLTATYTWQPASGQTTATDPPPSALIAQTCYLIWDTTSA